MTTVVSRTFRSSPHRDALQTWDAIVELLTQGKDGTARSELRAVTGVAAVNASLVFAPAALASLVVAVAVAWWAPRVPRVTRHWFYPFYPAHLAVIRWLG